jgi:hypothetical protein
VSTFPVLQARATIAEAEAMRASHAAAARATAKRASAKRGLGARLSDLTRQGSGKLFHRGSGAAQRNTVSAGDRTSTMGYAAGSNRISVTHLHTV